MRVQDIFHLSRFNFQIAMQGGITTTFSPGPEAKQTRDEEDLFISGTCVGPGACHESFLVRGLKLYYTKMNQRVYLEVAYG